MDVEIFPQRIAVLNHDPATAPMEEEDGAILESSKLLDDSSSAIADKLLQGWTLMNEHCPRCYMPLVRNKQKKLYCVACRQWVITEAEAEALRQKSKNVEVLLEPKNPQQSQLSADVAPRSLLLSPGRTDAANHTRVASLRGEDQDTSEERHAKRLAADSALLNTNKVSSTGPLPLGVSDLLGFHNAMNANCGELDAQCAFNFPANSSAKSSQVLPKVDLPSNIKAVLSTTLSTVVQKVEETRGLIASAQSTGELSQLLDVLLKLLDVTTRLQTLGIP